VAKIPDFKFEIMPQLPKFVTLVFPVPKKSLDSSWTLLIQNKNDKTSPGMMKIGIATKIPA